MAKNQTDSILRKIFLVVPLLGLLCLVVSIGLAIKVNQFTQFTYAGLAIGILLFLTLFVKAEVANLKYYLNVFVYSALVLGICVVGYMIVRQYKHQIDLTKENLYSLNPASKNYLRNKLSQDVDIVFFTDTREAFNDIEEMYASESKHLKFKYINPVKNRLEATNLATDLGITKPSVNDLVLKCGAKTKRMSINELLQGNYENVLTNAIIEVAAGDSIKVYFISGHGELPFDAPAPRRRGEARQPSVQLFRQMLSDRGMQTETLDLLAKGAVPDDAKAVIIAGPNGDLSDPEIASLRAYLDKGGRLLLLVGPSIEQQRAEAYEKLSGLLKDYGILLPNDIILDMLSARIMDAAKPLVGFMDPAHPITKDLANANVRSALTLVRPVATLPVKDSRIQAVELIKSSEQSFLWPVEDALRGVKPTPPREEDMKARTMGVAIGMGEPPQIPGQNIPKPNAYRLVVYGTPDLATDQTIASQPAFQMLMLNTMNWLTEREDALNIPPRRLPGTPIIIDEAQKRVMFVFAVILLPGLLFFGGVSYSLGRRK